MIKIRPGQRVKAIKAWGDSSKNYLIDIGDVFIVDSVLLHNGLVTCGIKISPKEILMGVPEDIFEVFKVLTFSEELNEVLIKNNIKQI